MVSFTPSSEDVRLYEIAVLYPYPMNQKEETDLIKAVETIFTDAGAKQIFKDSWGRRGLAYNVGGFREGNFIVYYEEMDPKKVKEVDNDLKILKGVLRHLIVKPPKHYEIRSFADAEKQWKEQSRIHGEQQAQEREDKLKKQVVEKARRKQVPDRKKEIALEEAKPVTGEMLTQEIDKLISDKDLEL